MTGTAGGKQHTQDISRARQRQEGDIPQLRRVLLVGEFEELFDGVGLESTMYETVAVDTYQEAIELLDDEPIDCLVARFKLSSEDGTSLVERVRERYCELPIVFVVQNGSEQIASTAITAGVDEYVSVDRDVTLEESLTEALDRVLVGGRECVARTELEGVEAAIENAADAIIITDRKGTIEYVNPAFEELTGYTREQAVGRNPRILKSGKQDTEYYERMWDTITDGRIWEETIVNEKRDGDQYIAHQTVAPVIDRDDEIDGFVGIQRDITREQLLEEQLERSETTLTRLHELAMGADVELQTKLDKLVELGTRHLNYPVGYITKIEDGQQHLLAVAGDHESMEQGKTDPLDRTYCRKTIDSDEPTIICDAKAEGWESDSAFEEFGLRCYLGARIIVDGEVYGTLCFGDDSPRDSLALEAQRSTIQSLANWLGHEIAREQYEQKLEQQNERLERFASAISHDLRNPLNVAQNYTQLALDQSELAHVEPALDAHDRMEAIIEDTLTMARESTLVEEPEEISLAALAQRCWDNVDTREATLEFEDDPLIHGDPDKLPHVFENLFRNAVEHAGPSVRVHIGSLEDGFYVEDDGPGIDEDEREYVFDYGHTTGDGSGFGLSIVEMIAQAHGWSVSVTDGELGGARFEFSVDESTDSCLIC